MGYVDGCPQLVEYDANNGFQTVVGTSAWVIHRNREIYGEDADEFRPERWLEKGKTGDLRKSLSAT